VVVRERLYDMHVKDLTVKTDQKSETRSAEA